MNFNHQLSLIQGVLIIAFIGMNTPCSLHAQTVASFENMSDEALSKAYFKAVNEERDTATALKISRIQIDRAKSQQEAVKLLFLSIELELALNDTVHSRQHLIKLAPLIEAYDEDYLNAQNHIEYSRLLLKMRMNQQALTHANDAVRLHPGSVMPLLHRARLNERLNRLEAAEEDYTNCLRIYPPLSVARYERARVIHRLGDTEQAINDLMNIWKYSSNIPKGSYYVTIGSMLIESGQVEKALKIYNMVLRNEVFENEYYKLYRLIAEAHLELNQLEEAHEAIDKSLSLQAKDAESQLVKAQVLMNLGIKEEACALLNSIQSSWVKRKIPHEMIENCQ